MLIPQGIVFLCQITILLLKRLQVFAECIRFRCFFLKFAVGYAASDGK